ncbi:MAG: hypothetical protein WCJ40_21485 [Planctomycetota bacterium]
MASNRKPTLGGLIPPQAQRPVALAPQSEKRWVFSFRFWKQIKNFGLEQSDSKWFIALLEKLADLSKLKQEQFLKDGVDRDNWRFHKIHWQQKNIPVQRKDLDWIPGTYLDNETEYELFQFQITQSLGRVIGFFDENQEFNIVLLDPLHNMQPSKSFDYKVHSCKPDSTHYADLLKDVEKAQKHNCLLPECPAYIELCRLPRTDHAHMISIMRLHEETYIQMTDCIDRYNSTIEDILDYGMMFMDHTSKKDSPPLD